MECPVCGGDVLKSQGSVGHCEFVLDPESYGREEDGAVITCIEKINIEETLTNENADLGEEPSGKW